MGLLCSVSRRKSFKEIDRIIGTERSKRTLQREVQSLGQEKCRWLHVKNSPCCDFMWMARKCVYNKPMGKDMTREIFGGLLSRGIVY